MNKELKDENQVLKEQVDCLKAQLEETIKERDSLKNRVSELENSLQALENDHKKLKFNFDETVRLNEILQNKLKISIVHDLRNQIEQLTKELEDSKNRIAIYQKESQNVRKTLSSKMQKIKTQEQEITTLKKKIQTLEIDLNKKSQFCTKFLPEMQKSQALIEALCSENEQLRKQLQEEYNKCKTREENVSKILSQQTEQSAQTQLPAVKQPVQTGGGGGEVSVQPSTRQQQALSLREQNYKLMQQLETISRTFMAQSL